MENKKDTPYIVEWANYINGLIKEIVDSIIDDLNNAYKEFCKNDKGEREL